MMIGVLKQDSATVEAALAVAKVAALTTALAAAEAAAAAAVTVTMAAAICAQEDINSSMVALLRRRTLLWWFRDHSKIPLFYQILLKTLLPTIPNNITSSLVKIHSIT